MIDSTSQTKIRRFQSTPSAWRETSFACSCFRIDSFQSTPSAWRETQPVLFFQRTCIFQSTPSAWRETCLDHSDPPQHRYFNPLPPHGGRRCTTHRLLWKMHFNPLPPHGGRLGVLPVYQCRIGISIHSLRMEGDSIRYAVSLFPPYFNPLPPHGGRRCSPSAFSSTSVFQSTPSAWRETSRSESDRSDFTFQSTPSAWRETPDFRDVFP